MNGVFNSGLEQFMSERLYVTEQVPAVVMHKLGKEIIFSFAQHPDNSFIPGIVHVNVKLFQKQQCFLFDCGHSSVFTSLGLSE